MDNLRSRRAAHGEKQCSANKSDDYDKVVASFSNMTIAFNILLARLQQYRHRGGPLSRMDRAYMVGTFEQWRHLLQHELQNEDLQSLARSPTCVPQAHS